MYTIEQAKQWVKDNQFYLDKDRLNTHHPRIPEFFFKTDIGINLWNAGCFLNEKLKEMGATKQEIQNIGFVHGQKSFLKDPYEEGIKLLNEYSAAGRIEDKPGLELGKKLYKEYLKK
jgi:hypothetical protein